jgi:predicted hydrolase (HD superfamily)
MLTRDQAISLINEHVLKNNIVKHMLATEALMGGIYDELKSRGKTDEELGGTKEEWMMSGLLHDGDYCESVPMEKQGVQISDWVKEKGLEIPENVSYSMASHNWSMTGVEPKSLMDWTIFLGDSLTGLIVASTLVLPSKKLADLTVENVLKRFKELKFASGTRRDDIIMCEKELGLSLEEFVTICLKEMKGIAKEIGL